jgi:hypothetical protein
MTQLRDKLPFCKEVAIMVVAQFACSMFVALSNSMLSLLLTVSKL